MTTVDFYDKEQVDDLLGAKADKSDTYTKTEVNTALGAKANSADVYTKAEIDAKEIGATTDTASASGSLWARIKYVLAHWMTTDTEQTITAKKTFSVSPDVPTTPAGTGSAINSAYVNDATDGVNNIVHKSGYEIINSIKQFAPRIDLRGEYSISSTAPATKKYWEPIKFLGANGSEIARININYNTNNTVEIVLVVSNSDGTFNKSVNLIVSNPIQ